VLTMLVATRGMKYTLSSYRDSLFLHTNMIVPCPSIRVTEPSPKCIVLSTVVSSFMNIA
jgi:hypothetical protein